MKRGADPAWQGENRGQPWPGRPSSCSPQPALQQTRVPKEEAAVPSEVWAAHPTFPPAPCRLGPVGRSHLGSLPGGGGLSLQTSFPTTTERTAPQRCRLGVQEGLLCLQGTQPAPLGVGVRGHSCNLWEPEARRREASPAGAPQHPRAAQGQRASDLPSPGPRLLRPQGSGGPSDLGTRPEQPVDGPPLH